MLKHLARKIKDMRLMVDTATIEAHRDADDARVTFKQVRFELDRSHRWR